MSNTKSESSASKQSAFKRAAVELSAIQETLLAQALLKARPPVIPGTRVILDDTARNTWYKCVTEIASAIGVTDQWFFDTCGVPD
jgi:hypothetical protein